MRTTVMFVVLAAAVALGGCFFHHREQVYTAELPPPIDTTPYK
jgi:hypothetical protein